MNLALAYMLMMMMMIYQSQAQNQCWKADPYSLTTYQYLDNRNCLNNSLIPRNATKLYDLHSFNYDIGIGFNCVQ